MFFQGCQKPWKLTILANKTWILSNFEQKSLKKPGILNKLYMLNSKISI